MAKSTVITCDYCESAIVNKIWYNFVQHSTESPVDVVYGDMCNECFVKASKVISDDK